MLCLYTYGYFACIDVFVMLMQLIPAEVKRGSSEPLELVLQLTVYHVSAGN